MKERTLYIKPIKKDAAQGRDNERRRDGYL